MQGFIEGLENKYRNVFVVDSMLNWDENTNNYNSKCDLVLTYDFELNQKISALGGKVFYIDHLVDKDVMQKNNFLIYKFFTDWHYDVSGKDIFTYKDIPFGFSLRLEFWNDFTTYIRIYLSMTFLSKVEMDNLYISTSDETIVSILKKLEINFSVNSYKQADEISFYFPIAQWMDERIRPSGLRAFLYKSREIVTYVYGTIMMRIDNIFKYKNRQKVFIQEYHPTKKILAHLRKDKNVHVLLTNFSCGSKFLDNLSERLLPIGGKVEKYEGAASFFIHELQKRKSRKLLLENGDDITQVVYEMIEKRIVVSLPNILRTLDGCISYMDKNTVDLEILIANIGHTATLFDCVCKSKHIPSYLIINGLLGSSYSDESKYATVINSYSQSIKENYFKDMDNIVVLGDPRMDMYSHLEKNVINRNNPTITIGTSGFNPTDLNSYVAVEFDFMYDILKAFSLLKAKNERLNLIIKVRPNGYKEQYEKFTKKFFPNLDIKIEDMATMKEVLKKTDFYVSIYSQTLFEASCLGIPVVYYKKDTEIIDPPFDNNSELVTITNIDDMIQAFYDFQNEHERYTAFLNRKIMEKYIGPLDGHNLQRNIDFVYELLEKQEGENA